jgi:hypothetical protein
MITDPVVTARGSDLGRLARLDVFKEFREARVRNRHGYPHCSYFVQYLMTLAENQEELQYLGSLDGATSRTTQASGA